MDPITLTIIAAVTAGLTAGITKGTTKVTEQAIVDAYEGLKSLIKNKFGDDNGVTNSIVALEKEPDFEPNKVALQGRVAQLEADKDKDILKSARELQELLQDKPEGAQAIQHIQNVYGDYNATAGSYGTATVNVNQTPNNE